MDERELLDRLGRLQEDQGSEAAFLKLCGFYRKLTPAERAVLRTLCDDTVRRRWRPPKASDFSLRHPLASADRLRAGLIYHAIEDLRHDARDTLIGLAAIYHAALKCGLDPAALFEEVASISSDGFAAFLRGFLGRSPELRSLGAFGWTDRSTADRILFLA